MQHERSAESIKAPHFYCKLVLCQIWELDKYPTYYMDAVGRKGEGGYVCSGTSLNADYLYTVNCPDVTFFRGKFSLG